MKPSSLLHNALLLSALAGTTSFQSSNDFRSVIGTSHHRHHQETAEHPPFPFSTRPSFHIPNTPTRRQQSTASTTSTALSSALVSTALGAIDTFWKTSPYAAAALVCGFKASAADYVAQQRQFRKDSAATDAIDAEDDSIAASSTAAAVALPQPKTDKLRNLSYLIYGAVYQGMTQEYVYNHLYPVMFGTGTDPVTVLSKVCFDLFVQTTLVTLPIAYLTKALIFRYSIKEAFRRYTDDIRNHGLLTKYFSLWGPVQCLTFSIVPEHFRVTFIAAVSFFWLIILSSIASKPREAATEDGETMVIPNDCPMIDGLTCELEFKD